MTMATILTHEWHVGERVVTRDGTVAIVVARDGSGNVLGVGPRDSIPRVVRPVCDAWGGEMDAAYANAA